MAEKNQAEGIQLRRKEVVAQFDPSPGQTLVKRTLEAIAAIQCFQDLFGKLKGFDQAEQRYACYEKFDWSLRALPAVCLFESEPEIKQSDSAFVDGALRMMVFWPASFRRSDKQQIPVAFKGAMQNFFASQFAAALLDPCPGVNTATKVPGLNKLGSELTWQPQVEGNIGNEAVPVTVLDVKYRIDLRRWYQFLEEQGYTQADPFTKTAFSLDRIEGEYDGVTAETPLGDADIVFDEGFNIPEP